MTGTTTMVNWVRTCWAVKHFTMLVWCAVLVVVLGVGGQMILGRTAPPYWIIFCGNLQGQGQCAPDFVAGGWVSEGNYTAVVWQAAIEQGTARETDEAMAAGQAVWDAHCRNNECIIAGFSLGNSPAIQLSGQVGAPPQNTYLFGAPQPSTGVFHNQYPDNPFIEPWIVTMGGLDTDRAVTAGMQAFYTVRDPYANAAPQCAGPGLFALGLDGHYVVSRDEANNSRVWTGPDGVVMHEVGYVPPPGLPLSGSDPPPFWAGCLPPNTSTSNNDTPAEPGPFPFVPGVPQVPGG